MREMSLKNSALRRFKIKACSFGLDNLDSTWNIRAQRMTKEFVFQRFAIGKHTTTMSTSVTVEDSLLLHLLIDATSLLLRLLTYLWELLHKVQLVPVRQKLPRISVELLVSKSLYSTAQIK